MDIERLNAEKNDIHNQSIHVVEQSDQRQQKIKQLEAVSYFCIFYLTIYFIYLYFSIN